MKIFNFDLKCQNMLVFPSVHVCMVDSVEAITNRCKITITWRQECNEELWSFKTVTMAKQGVLWSCFCDWTEFEIWIAAGIPEKQDERETKETNKPKSKTTAKRTSSPPHSLLPPYLKRRVKETRTEIKRNAYKPKPT